VAVSSASTPARSSGSIRKTKGAKARASKRHWTERFVRLMDDGIRLPLIGGLGLDAVLGFFLPVAGDTLATWRTNSSPCKVSV